MAAAQHFDATFDLIAERGPAHDRIFVARVTARSRISEGTGPTKKAAYEAAARGFMEAYGSRWLQGRERLTTEHSPLGVIPKHQGFISDLARRLSSLGVEAGAMRGFHEFRLRSDLESAQAGGVASSAQLGAHVLEHRSTASDRRPSSAGSVAARDFCAGHVFGASPELLGSTI